MAIREPYVPTPAIERAYTRTGLAAMILAISAAILALAILLYVLWMIFSKQDSKLYEADNTVCVSQPYAIHCFERRTAP